jgi:hypothetical protein
MRYRLRTLLIVLAILPPLLWIGWTKFAEWKAEQERRAYLRRVETVQIPLIIDEEEGLLVPGVLPPIKASAKAGE